MTGMPITPTGGPTELTGPEELTVPAPRARSRWWAGLSGDEVVAFDPPGPRGRRRIAVASALSLTALAALVAVAVREFAVHGQLQASQWRLFIQWPVMHYLLNGLGATLEVTVVSGAIALPAGIILCLGRLSRLAVLRWPATAYTQVLRSVPLLLLIYAFLFGLPDTGIRLPLFWQLAWPIVLTNSAVLAEIFRAGVLAVDRGQSEAAHSLGLRYWPTMLLIVVPQAIRHVIPSLVSQLVRLLKDSTLGYVVSYTELLYTANVLGEYDHAVVQAFLVVSAVYVIVNNLLATAAGRLERRLNPGTPLTEG